MTAREAELLEAQLRGIAREEFVERRGISINTYKTQVRTLLRKMRRSSLGELRDAMLRRMAESP